MNAVPAFFDQAVELVHPRLPTIVQLTRGTRPKTARKQREDQRLEDRFKVAIKRTVDEHVIGRQPRLCQIYFFALWTVFAADRALATVIFAPFVAGASTYLPVTALRPTFLASLPGRFVDVGAAVAMRYMCSS